MYSVQFRKDGPWEFYGDECNNPQVFTLKSYAEGIADWCIRQEFYMGCKVRVVKVDIVVKPYEEQ